MAGIYWCPWIDGNDHIISPLHDHSPSKRLIVEITVYENCQKKITNQDKMTKANNKWFNVKEQWEHILCIASHSLCVASHESKLSQGVTIVYYYVLPHSYNAMLHYNGPDLSNLTSTLDFFRDCISLKDRWVSLCTLYTHKTNKLHHHIDNVTNCIR